MYNRGNKGNFYNDLSLLFQNTPPPPENNSSRWRRKNVMILIQISFDILKSERSKIQSNSTSKSSFELRNNKKLLLNEQEVLTINKKINNVDLLSKNLLFLHIPRDLEKNPLGQSLFCKIRNEILRMLDGQIYLNFPDMNCLHIIFF